MSPGVVGAVVALVFAVVGGMLIHELRERRREQLLVRLAATFAPAIAHSSTDPHELVAWASVARTMRKLFPEAFRQLDPAAGGQFPFSSQLIEAAHVRWTSDWLAWERRHDVEYKEQARVAEAEMSRVGQTDASTVRARLAMIEQEKLQTYQERYEEYVRVGKAITALEATE